MKTMQPITCPYCNFDCPPQSSYCPGCGKALRQACGQCGFETLPEFAFCPQCGGQLSDVTQYGHTIQEHLTLNKSLRRLVPKEYADRLLATQGQLGRERRKVTILFSDVKGSTAMAEGLDPEDVAEIMDGVFDFLIEPIYRYEGTLARLMGDGVLAFFGAPIAHEDDPQRAVRAGLEICDRARSYAERLRKERSILGFDVGVGIHTGLVVVGEVGSDLRVEYTAMGDATNLAARMEQASEPGTVFISEATQHLVRALFEMEELGPVSVKGKQEPVLMYRVLSTRPQAPDIGCASGFASAMVGRERELNQLLGLLDEVEGGESRVVSLEAEAGLGKSRLVAEWAACAGERGLRVYWGAALSIEQHTPYRAWRDILSAFLGLEKLTSVSARQTQVETRVRALASEARTYIPLLNDILDLAFPDNELTRSLSAQGRQQALITLLLSVFGAATAKSPLLLVLEDVHWLDAISWELVLQLTRGLAADNAPFMLVLVTRPTDDLPAAAATLRKLPCWRHFPLASLSSDAIEALVSNDLGVADGRLPAELLSLVQSKADGNPFFAEELLLNLQAHGVVEVRPDPDSGQRACFIEESLGRVASALPDSLQGVILARLDRLPLGQQQVLKLAAVIGREFAYSPLQYLYQRYRATRTVALDAELAHLQGTGFVQTEVLEHELAYQFKHAVIRDVAYETLLYAQRRLLHRSVATWYEQAHRGQVATSPYLPLLAHHYRLAEDGALERQYAHLAGQQAAARYANADALIYLHRALDLTPEPNGAEQYEVLGVREEIFDRLGQRKDQKGDLDRLATLASTAEQRCAVALRYGEYHNNVGNYEATIAVSEQAYDWAAQSGDKTSQAQALINAGRALMHQGAYERAIDRIQHAYELAQAASASTQIASALSGLGGIAFRQGDYATASHYHQQSLRLSEEMNDLSGQVQSLRNLGQVAYDQGEYDLARGHYLHALQLAKQMGNRPYEGRLLLDFGRSYWRQGAYEQAETYLQQGWALNQATGDRPTAAVSLRNLGIVASQLGQYDKAVDYWGQSLAISNEIGDRDGAGRTLNNLGLVAMYQGQFDRAIAFYEQSLAISQETGDRAMEGRTLNNLGEAVFAQGRYAKAMGYYEQSLAISQGIGDRYVEGLTLSNIGAVASRMGRHDEAAAHLQQGLTISYEVGDRAMESYTLNKLGQLAAGQELYAKAQDYYERSLAIRQEIGDRSGEGEVFTNMGALALAQSAFSRAEALYQRASAIHDELNQAQWLPADWIGLAFAALRQGEIETARTYADRVLAVWRSHPKFELLENPIRAFYHTWQVCQGLGLAQAEEVLAAAVQIIQEQLSLISDSEERDAYLGQPYHRAIWQLGTMSSSRG